MQVEGDDAIHPCGLDGVCAHPRPYRHARLVLLVALRVAEVRDDRGNRRSASALERVDPEDQLHEVVVRRERGPLYEEHVATSDVLEDAHEEVPLRETEGLVLAERTAQVLGDRAPELAAGRTCEQQELVIGHRLNLVGYRLGANGPGAALRMSRGQPLGSAKAAMATKCRTAPTTVPGGKNCGSP